MSSKQVRKLLYIPMLKALTSFLIVCAVYFLFAQPQISSAIFVLSIGFLYATLFYIAPILALYLTHRKSCKGKSLSVEGNKIKVSLNNANYIWPEDFNEATVYQTFAKFNNRFDWSLWGEYAYIVLFGKNGEKIILSLLLDERLEAINLKRKKKFFPIPPKDKF